MAEVVISYARDNQATARQLAEAVEREGYDVWWDDSDASDADAVTEQIVGAKASIVIWSSVAIGSDEVRAEASVARALKKLIQASADDKTPPAPFATDDIIAISSWIGAPDHKGWLAIKAALESMCGRPAAEQTVPPEPASPELAPAAESPATLAANAVEPVAAAAAPPAQASTTPPASEPAAAPAAPAPPPAAAATAASQKKSNGLVLAIVAVVLVGLVGGGGYYYWTYMRPAAAVVATAEPEQNEAAPQPAAPTQPATPPVGIPELGPAAEEFTREAVITASSGFAAVRSAPSALGINIARINPGETFSTYPQTGDWWRVRTASGTIGYMAQSDIRIRDPEAERRSRERAERRQRGPRVRYVNSENMRLFCEGAGKGTPNCRTFRRNER